MVSSQNFAIRYHADMQGYDIPVDAGLFFKSFFYIAVVCWPNFIYKFQNTQAQYGQLSLDKNGPLLMVSLSMTGCMQK